MSLITSVNEKESKNSETKLKNNKDNLLWRVHVDELQSNIDEFRCNSGYFAEYCAEDLKEIEGIINKIRSEFSDKMTTVATGGLAPLFGRETKIFDFIDLDITMHGMNVIYNFNQSKK